MRFFHNHCFNSVFLVAALRKTATVSWCVSSSKWRHCSCIVTDIKHRENCFYSLLLHHSPFPRPARACRSANIQYSGSTPAAWARETAVFSFFLPKSILSRRRFRLSTKREGFLEIPVVTTCFEGRNPIVVCRTSTYRTFCAKSTYIYIYMYMAPRSLDFLTLALLCRKTPWWTFLELSVLSWTFAFACAGIFTCAERQRETTFLIAVDWTQHAPPCVQMDTWGKRPLLRVRGEKGQRRQRSPTYLTFHCLKGYERIQFLFCVFLYVCSCLLTNRGV